MKKHRVEELRPTGDTEQREKLHADTSTLCVCVCVCECESVSVSVSV